MYLRYVCTFGFKIPRKISPRREVVAVPVDEGGNSRPRLAIGEYKEYSGEDVKTYQEEEWAPLKNIFKYET